MLIGPMGSLFHGKGAVTRTQQALEQVVQVGCEISVLADTQNSTGQTYTSSALSGRLDQTGPRGPFQLQLLYDSVNKAEFKAPWFPVCFKRAKRKCFIRTTEVKRLPFRPAVLVLLLDRTARLRAARGQRQDKRLLDLGD